MGCFGCRSVQGLGSHGVYKIWSCGVDDSGVEGLKINACHEKSLKLRIGN